MRTNAGSNATAALLSILTIAAMASAASDEFDFKDPKGVNAIYFVLDSELEPIMGMATGISGTVNFDPENPKDVTGKIVVRASSVHTSNKKMTTYLRSKDWLDTKTHKTIEFEFKEVTKVETPRDNVFHLTVVADFTCKGITREITVPVRVAYLTGKMAARMRGKEGDLLALRVDFTIKRSDFGIKAGMMEQSVADEIELKVRIIGGHATE